MCIFMAKRCAMWDTRYGYGYMDLNLDLIVCRRYGVSMSMVYEV